MDRRIYTSTCLAVLAAGCAGGEPAAERGRVRGPDAGVPAAPVLVPLGEVDPTFGEHGIAALPVADLEPRALAVQPDGKIVVAASRFDDPNSNFEGYVIRVLPDGSLDPSFDGDGVLLLDAHGIGAWTLALAPGGELVLGGASDAEGVAQLWRLRPDGSPDPTFAGDGALALGAESAWIDHVAVAADGTVLAKGEAAADGLYVTRVRRDGTLDPGYHTGVVSAGAFIEHDSVALPDGSWVVAGNVDDDVHPRTTNLGRIGPGGATGGGLDLVAIDAEYVDTAALAGERVLLGAGRTPEAWVEARRFDGALDPGFQGGLGRERGVVRILVHGDGAFDVLCSDDKVLRLHHRRAGGAADGSPWQSALPATTWLSHVQAALDPTTGDLLVAAQQHDKVGDRYLVTGTGLSRIPGRGRRR